jgi:hypothetical protein
MKARSSLLGSLQHESPLQIAHVNAGAGRRQMGNCGQFRRSRRAAWVLAATPIAVLLFGCASAGRIAPLPLVDPGIASKVVVIRVSSLVGAAVRYTVALDGTDLFRVGTGQHAEFSVAPGEHRIAVKCFGGWSPTWKEDARTFAAMSGTTAYFRVSPNMSCAEIAAVTAAEATRLLPDSTLLNLTGSP